jgi:hypothetical protein
MQQLFHGTKAVGLANLKNGYIEIQCNWPKAFSGAYIILGIYQHNQTASPASSVYCCKNAGLRDVAATGFIQVVSWDAANPPTLGDVIDVWGVGIQNDPDAPSKLTASLDVKLVTLNWQSSNQQVYYNVFRSTIKGGPYTGYGTHIGALTWQQTVNTKGTYYYVVNAVNLDNSSLVSGYSNEVQVVIA